MILKLIDSVVSYGAAKLLIITNENYLCSYMQTNFNADELNLIQNRIWFELKASAAGKTSAFLEEIDRLIRGKQKMLCLENAGASKITKGENLGGFPYFVLDMPKLKDEQSIFTIRIIVWWGNYISVNLLLGELVFDQYRNRIIENIGRIQNHDLFISISENLWQHDVYDDKHYIRSVDITGELLLKLRSFKVCSLLQLNSINIKNNLLESIETLNAILI
jgi:hypothetical protein